MPIVDRQIDSISLNHSICAYTDQSVILHLSITGENKLLWPRPILRKVLQSGYEFLIRLGIKKRVVTLAIRMVIIVKIPIVICVVAVPCLSLIQLIGATPQAIDSIPNQFQTRGVFYR